MVRALGGDGNGDFRVLMVNLLSRQLGKNQCVEQEPMVIFTCLFQNAHCHSGKFTWVKSSIRQRIPNGGRENNFISVTESQILGNITCTTLP